MEIGSFNSVSLFGAMQNAVIGSTGFSLFETAALTAGVVVLLAHKAINASVPLIDIFRIRTAEHKRYQSYVDEVSKRAGMSDMIKVVLGPFDKVGSGSACSYLPSNLHIITMPKMQMKIDEESVLAVTRHELGHIYHKHRGSDKPLLVCEQEADQFAIDTSESKAELLGLRRMFRQSQFEHCLFTGKEIDLNNPFLGNNRKDLHHPLLSDRVAVVEEALTKSGISYDKKAEDKKALEVAKLNFKLYHIEAISPSRQGALLVSMVALAAFVAMVMCSHQTMPFLTIAFFGGVLFSIGRELVKEHVTGDVARRALEMAS